MRNHQAGGILAILAGACCVAPAGVLSATATENTIHVFKGGNDGAGPYAGLISDGAGNTYGTTSGGGGGCADGGCGTVFELTKNKKQSVLYAFKGGSDGSSPDGSLMLDVSGTLYGTTLTGGGTGCGGYGCGTLFKLAPDGTETVLYAFQGSSDGYQPGGNVVMDQSGDLYGTTAGGGTYNATCTGGCGTIFELRPDGTKITLYEFQGGNDGEGPSGDLISDSSGNLYGTTSLGGEQCNVSKFGCGTVFKITPSGKETILYAFQGGIDGFEPFGGVVADGAGNLYGTTLEGGAEGCCGVVFEVPAVGGSETTLYSFRGGSDGEWPAAGVVRDSDGNLYGTTEVGGGKGCKKLFGNGCGTVFELTPDGKEKVLFAFSSRYGQLPEAPLLIGKNGNLYGTTTQGGAHKDGVVFEVKK
jgi:uncharacterized repeat protein (TIGR03803 family)